MANNTTDTSPERAYELVGMFRDRGATTAGVIVNLQQNGFSRAEAEMYAGGGGGTSSSQSSYNAPPAPGGQTGGTGLMGVTGGAGSTTPVPQLGDYTGMLDNFTPSPDQMDPNIQAQAAQGLYQSQLATGYGALDAANAALQNDLAAADRFLGTELGYVQQSRDIGVAEQEMLQGQALGDLEFERAQQDAAKADEIERLQGLSDTTAASASLRAALAGATYEGAQKGVERVVEAYSGQMSKVERDHMLSDAYLSKLGKDISQSAAMNIAKIDIETNKGIQDIFNEYQTVWESVTEGKRANEAQRALLQQTTGAELFAKIAELTENAYDKKKEIQDNDRDFALRVRAENRLAGEAGFGEYGTGGVGGTQKARWTHTAISDEDWLAKTDDEKIATINEMHRLEGGAMSDRAIRHNNPTAMTTDVAATLGLVEGVDYTQGDAFPDNPNLFTARFLGDGVETTIRALDQTAENPNRSAFYTGSPLGNTVPLTNFEQSLVENPKLIGEMTPTEKTKTLKTMANKGININGIFGDAVFQDYDTDNIEDLQGLVKLRSRVSKINTLKQRVNTGYFETAYNEGIQFLGGDTGDFNMLQALAGTTLADYIKEISGAAVSEEEAQRLSKNIMTMTQQDGDFNNKLQLFNEELELRIKQKVSQYKFRSDKDMYKALGIEYVPPANIARWDSSLSQTTMNDEEWANTPTN